MILLDTSFLYGYFQENDIHHKKACASAQEFFPHGQSIPQEILEEFISLVAKRSGSEEAITLGQILLGSESPVEILPRKENDFKRVWRLFQTLSPHTLSYADCLLITLAREYQCPILTFDKAIVEVMKNNG